MTGEEILKSMENGSTLHGREPFGFWLMDVFNTRCINVHNGAARSLVRKRLIQKAENDRWVKVRTPAELRQEILDRMNHFYRQTDGSMAFPNSCEGDILKMAHKFILNLQTKP